VKQGFFTRVRHSSSGLRAGGPKWCCSNSNDCHRIARLGFTDFPPLEIVPRQSPLRNPRLPP